jgi:hypothetical protein
MIRSNQELYGIVTELAKQLGDIGEGRLATGLRDALTVSTLPGEVLGEVRMELQRAVASSAYYRLDIRSRVDDSLRYIDSVLGS